MTTYTSNPADTVRETKPAQLTAAQHAAYRAHPAADWGCTIPPSTHAEEQHEKSSLLRENTPENHNHSTVQGLLLVSTVNQLNSNTHVFFKTDVFS